MRHPSFAACLSLILSAAGIRAGEPESQVVPAAPQLLMASATACDDIVTLHLRTVQLSLTTQETVLKVPVQETLLVKGRVVERKRTLEERRVAQVLRPAPGAMVDVTVDGVAVVVYEMNGKPVPPSKLKNMLKKETAILVSTTGPVDPYYLQTTKGGTLIVLLPPQVLAAPTGPELLIPPTPAIRPGSINPNEPPIAPAKR